MRVSTKWKNTFDELCYMAVRANFLTLQIPLEWSISAMMGENYWFRVQQISINVDCVEIQINLPKLNATTQKRNTFYYNLF